MTADRNLLFGVLALQAGLIDACQFAEASALWATRRDTQLAEVFIERGWILPADRIHLEYLADRKIRSHDGQAEAILASAAPNSENVSPCPGEREGAAPQPGATIAFTSDIEHRYSTIRLHASGGIGDVWLACDNHLGRRIALKRLRPERGNDHRLAKRFLREARITGQLEHPGIVPVYELCEGTSGQPYYTMRFVKGRTLSESVQDYHRKRSNMEANSSGLQSLLNSFVTVCNTLAYAHSCGVIHRDLKGQNIVLGDFGEVVVLDWGLAKKVTEKDGESSQFEELPVTPKFSSPLLTVQGQALGTPAYMAPEQAAGKLNEIDQLTDVYGLGAILYEILTGQPPFTGGDTSEILHKVQHDNPVPATRLCPDVPPLLESACMRAISKDRTQRFASASDLAQVVEQWQETERKRAEDALRASEALYHSLVETIPMNVWRKDAEGRYTFANQGFCQTTSRTVDELLGKNDFDLFPPELATKYRHDDAAVMATGEPFDATEDHVTAKGEQIYVRVVKLPIYDAHGKIVGTQGIFWDVTDHVRLELKLAQTNDELDRVREQLKQIKGNEQQ